MDKRMEGVGPSSFSKFPPLLNGVMEGSEL